MKALVTAPSGSACSRCWQGHSCCWERRPTTMSGSTMPKRAWQVVHLAGPKSTQEQNTVIDRYSGIRWCKMVVE